MKKSTPAEDHQLFIKRVKTLPIELNYGIGEYPVSVSINERYIPLQYFKQLMIEYSIFIKNNLEKLKGIHIMDWKGIAVA